MSGISYRDFMQRQIFQLLQMHSTDIETAARPVATVIGYTQERKGITESPFCGMR